MRYGAIIDSSCGATMGRTSQAGSTSSSNDSDDGRSRMLRASTSVEHPDRDRFYNTFRVPFLAHRVGIHHKFNSLLGAHKQWDDSLKAPISI